MTSPESRLARRRALRASRSADRVFHGMLLGIACVALVVVIGLVLEAFVF